MTAFCKNHDTAAGSIFRLDTKPQYISLVQKVSAMASRTDDEMTEQNTNSLGSSESTIQQPTKRARCGSYSGPSDRADVVAHMPAGHTWTCADCGQELRPEVGVNNIPLCHSGEDLKNMRLPVWISYQEVWKGTYCSCVSLCDTCLDKFYGEITSSIVDINEREEKYEEERKNMAASSFEQRDFLSPTGNSEMPTRQLQALMRTVLVQIREAIFSIMCNRDKHREQH